MPARVIAAADQIKHLNYKTTTPAKFRKSTFIEDLACDMMAEVAARIDIEQSSLDYIYFRRRTALNRIRLFLIPKCSLARTFVIPVILPQGRSVITAESASPAASLGCIYEFNHERVDWMTVEDTESGCVVIMMAIRKMPAESP